MLVEVKLNFNGFEIITRPYDLEYYKKEGKEIFINALELLQNNKFRSHDGGRCGLHVHIGRHGLGNSYQERINTIRRINIIIEGDLYEKSGNRYSKICKLFISF